MNELNINLTKRQCDIILGLKYRNSYSAAEILQLKELNNISLATLKRDLSLIIKLNYIRLIGKGRNARYEITDYGFIHMPYDTPDYLAKKSMRTDSIISYNESLFDIFKNEQLFTDVEIFNLKEATKVFWARGEGISDTIRKKELERFVIELSWKSSKIEGNTYTLLDTEKLLKNSVVAVGKSKEETDMILNHKVAFSYILECTKIKKDLQSFRELENIHKLLVSELGIIHGFRNRGVGISGSRYLPLENGNRIIEEIKSLINIIYNIKDPFTKSLLAVLCISYIQPFEDGNKRTARLFANAMLIQNNLAPLSYRDVDENLYREALLIFYEQNSVEAFKKIFVEQYIFSCKTYNLGFN